MAYAIAKSEASASALTHGTNQAKVVARQGVLQRVTAQWFATVVIFDILKELTEFVQEFMTPEQGYSLW